MEIKKLAKYLADYLIHEHEKNGVDIYKKNLQEILENGLEAFQSTQNMTITIAGGRCPECNAPMMASMAIVFDGLNSIETGRYKCILCGYEEYF